MSGGPMTEAMYYVLLALHRPAHGYQLMQQIARASRGRVQMGPGTLYGVLTRMEKEGLIVLSENDGRRKTYLLTNAGYGSPARGIQPSARHGARRRMDRGGRNE
mgnify:CR=1 FL=1